MGAIKAKYIYEEKTSYEPMASSFEIHLEN